ncbi:MAG: pyridoxal phosphate-dependent aminotransferase [Phycisphaerae bacterium]
MPQPSVIASKVAADMQSASWIRAMFEIGRKMKAELGDANVYDFSLGNPNATPPAEFFEALRQVADERSAERHRYMANAGFDETRAVVARFLARSYDLPFEAGHVLLTSGTAGAMNVTLRAILNPGDEVVLLAPFFPEYRFYIEHANGVPVTVQTDDRFEPDLGAIERAITDRTRALIVNTPNNPTGVVYREEALRALGALLQRRDRPNRPLYLLCDDVYHRVLFDLDRCPTPSRHYARSIVLSSYSKDLSIPGERAGYVALHPALPERELLMGALTMLNRTLGFVNEAAIVQRVIARCADALCDLELYRGNRDRLCAALRDGGYELVLPGGAMFAFPKSPIADDAAFVQVLLNHRVLAVPGRGFGRPGHFRLAFCVDRETVERAAPAFRRARDEALGG